MKGVKIMEKYCVVVSIQEGKLAEIMARLQAAQDEIYKCYDELEKMGVLEIKKPPEATGGGKDHC